MIGFAKFRYLQAYRRFVSPKPQSLGALKTLEILFCESLPRPLIKVQASVAQVAGGARAADTNYELRLQLRASLSVL